MGNWLAKELLSMTQRHELRWGDAGGLEHTGQRGIKERKNGETLIA